MTINDPLNNEELWKQQQGILARQTVNAADPLNNAIKLVNDIDNTMGYSTKPQDWNIQHPFLNAAAKSLVGAGIGALAGDDLNDVFTGMAVGGMYGWSDSQRARKEWENEIHEHNEKTREFLLNNLRAGAQSANLKNLMSANQTSTETAQKINSGITFNNLATGNNTENTGNGYGGYIHNLGNVGMDSTGRDDASKIFGNMETAGMIPQLINRETSAINGNSELAGITKVMDLTPDQIQNDRLVNDYKTSKEYINGLGGYDRVRQLISDNTINPADRKVLQDKLTQHLNLYNQVQQKGLLNQDQPRNPIAGGVSSNTPVFIPSNDQITMARDISNAYEKGKRLQETRRYHDVTTDETQRHHLVGEGNQTRNVSSEIGRRGKLNQYTDIQIDKNIHPEKYHNPNRIPPEETNKIVNQWELIKGQIGKVNPKTGKIFTKEDALKVRDAIISQNMGRINANNLKLPAKGASW